jgi:DNA-binding CsgD family transcriptional regulator
MSTQTSKQRAFDRIVEISARGQDLVTLWRESSEVLRTAIPHYWYPCWYTIDPASLLLTSHYQEELIEFPDEFLQAEINDDEPHNQALVARSDSGISTLHEATGGDPSASRRWQANMEMGGDQELLASLRTERGEVWGGLGLYREPGQPVFDETERELVKAISPHLARGARTALLVGEASDPQWTDSPGLVVLSEKLEVESTTPGVERWLSDLPDGDWEAGRLPTAIGAIAGRALRPTGEENDLTVARVLSKSGTWVVLHGAPLLAPASRRVAVIVEPAHPARITPLLMSAYGLSEREQDVTRLVLQGESTSQIAAELFLSPHTVQDHLKGIFEKTGVRSRRDLVGKVFFAHYGPRFRDNEERERAEKPLRGEPFPPG